MVADAVAPICVAVAVALLAAVAVPDDDDGGGLEGKAATSASDLIADAVALASWTTIVRGAGDDVATAPISGGGDAAPSMSAGLP